ncbi:hypothetical protein POM88_026147 [Heracleum sosnowskyi]|uniref:Uncharacterized protein n=1 Tax=Heracleum sosnowskyi TaxID=360622 RepID=A0AAD8I5X4_9APIA|nr:hypothetical protein POM88_026147 [Heracleum sosnowskyi]
MLFYTPSKLQTLALIHTYKTLSTTATPITDSLPLGSSVSQTYSGRRPKLTWTLLKNKCGKTPTGISGLVGFELSGDENGPHSVVKVFQDFGFSETHISRILSKQPGILAYQPQKNLKPKLDFLFSITCSTTDVVTIVSKNPLIFTRSLNNHLLPFFNSLKSAAGSDKNAAAVIKCNPFLLSFCNSSSFVKNVEFLQTVGVPQNQILKLITKYGQSVGVKHEKFCKVVMRVKDMGFDLSSSYFREAVLCLTFLTESAWESRCEMYRSFGLSNDDIITMFKKQPVIMSFSEKRIREMLEFFVQRLQWSPSRFSNAPYVFSFSLQKRIIPRCSVLQALVSNKCDIKGFMLLTVLKMNESRFLKSFVTAYQDKVPEVLDAYQGKLTFGEYNFESESEGKFKIINSNRTISTAVTTDSLALTTPLLEQSPDENRKDSFIKLFESFGFPETHITRIIRKQRRILAWHPQRYVKPKLDFLLSITHSQSEVSDIVAKNPVMLTRSLKNHIIPLFTSLKSVTGSDQNAVAAIKRNPFLLSNCISTTFLQNIEFLQELGVPQIQILKLITEYGQSIGENHEKFCKVLLKVKDMGLDLSSSYFLDAVRSFSFLSDLAWESRCEMFRSFGFSNDDIISMAKKQPIIMSYSEKRMREMLEFFVQKLQWNATRLSSTPNVLRFLESFVTAYKEEVPEVIDAYQGKLKFDEYNFE